MKEIWKTVKGYEDYYMISNKGRIRTVARFIYYRKGSDVATWRASKIMKLKISKHGYAHIMLKAGNNRKDYSIHRLVAQAFIDNPDNLPTIDHIDGNKLNNNVNNLEWVSYKENNQRAYDLGLNRRIHAGQFAKGGGRIQ